MEIELTTFSKTRRISAVLLPVPHPDTTRLGVPVEADDGVSVEGELGLGMAVVEREVCIVEESMRLAIVGELDLQVGVSAGETVGSNEGIVDGYTDGGFALSVNEGSNEVVGELVGLQFETTAGAFDGVSLISFGSVGATDGVGMLIN